MMLSLRNSFVFCLVSLYVANAHGKNLPSYIEVCHRRDPLLNDCLKRNIEILRPRFLKGIKEMLIPSFNPLILPQAKLEIGDRFTATFKDLQIYGAEKFALDYIDFDAVNLKIKLHVILPAIMIESEYHLKGSILVLQLDGSGPSVGNYSKIDAIVTAHGEKLTKKGKTYIKLYQDDMDLNIGGGQLRFDNIFGDNQELNEQTNRILNENILELIKEFLPIIKQILNEFIFGIANRIFERYSYDELFPDP